MAMLLGAVKLRRYRLTRGRIQSLEPIHLIERKPRRITIIISPTATATPIQSSEGGVSEA
jgi:hypothetical protein